MDVMQWNRMTGRSDSGSGGHRWADMVSPQDYQRFVSSGAAGPGASYYDFQMWKQNQADAAREATQRADVMSLAKMADPFASQRGQYQTMLSDLFGVGSGGTTATAVPGAPAIRQGGMMVSGADGTAPGTTQAGTSRISDLLNKNPFFQANMDAGNEAAMRRLRAMGMGDSGNAAFELQKQGQANMSGEYWKMADMLGKMSGAYADPGAGANAALETMSLQEKQRQFDQGPNKQRYNGQSYGSPGMTLSSLGSYWGK